MQNLAAAISLNKDDENHCDNDELSSSTSGVATLGSIKSKFSVHKEDKRDHVEFSTRFSREFSKKRVCSINNQLQFSKIV